MIQAANPHHQVLSLRFLTDYTFVVRLERKNLQFQAGQYISVGLSGDMNMREYSIHGSSPLWLEILVRSVEGGHVSNQLKQVQPGDLLRVEGPFGFFTIKADTKPAPLWFIATGTGISPFRAMIEQHDNLDYTLLHGIRYPTERYGHEYFDLKKTITCLSGSQEAALPHQAQLFRGRVSAWLDQNPVPTNANCFLCGSCDMIYDVYDILRGKGITSENIHAEVYF